MFFTKKVGTLYLDRGDVAAYDFTASDFTKNSDWHDLDLTGVCPKGTKLALLRMQCTCSEAVKLAKFRTKGNTNEINTTIVLTALEGDYVYADIWVAPNAAGVIQYWFATATWSHIDVVVRGYIVG